MSFDVQEEDCDAEETSRARGDRPTRFQCSIRVTNRSRLHAGNSFVAPRPSSAFTPVHARSKMKGWVCHREANIPAYPLAGIFRGMLRSFAILPCFRRAAHRPYGAAAIWIDLGSSGFLEASVTPHDRHQHARARIVFRPLQGCKRALVLPIK
jgi:hypothetical protein